MTAQMRGRHSRPWCGDGRTTSNVARIPPFQTLLEPGVTGLPCASKAQEQVRSLDVRRFGPRVEQPPPAAIAKLQDALRLHLGL